MTGLSQHRHGFDTRSIHTVFCGGKIDSVKGLSMSVSVFPCQYHPTNVSYSCFIQLPPTPCNMTDSVANTHILSHVK